MTEIKLCGLSRTQDIEAANALKPEYIGFVFARASRRYVSPEKAAELKSLLDPAIRAVGVFVDEDPAEVARLLRESVIDIAQLHGSEDEAYIARLRELTDRPIVQAFQMKTPDVLARALASSADAILLDSGAGTGKRLNWEALKCFPWREDWIPTMRRRRSGCFTRRQSMSAPGLRQTDGRMRRR